MSAAMEQPQYQQFDPKELKLTNDPKILDGIHSLGLRKYNEAMEKGWKIQTTWDMLGLHYPYLMDDQMFGGLQKVDAPVISTTTGYFVATHGALAFEQIINEANVMGLLRKDPYTFGGFRALTAAGKTSDGGVGENAALPDSTKPTLANVTIGIKEISTTFDLSARQQFYSQTPNNVWNQPSGNALGALREFMGREHIKLMNRHVLVDNDTLASNNLESIDRVVGSFSEIDGVGQTAGDLDIYGLDRDAGATWADAYVNHNSGTDRDLTAAQIKSLTENAQPYWDGVNFRGDSNYTGVQNKIWLTGYDTKNRIEQIYETSNRYQNNGIEIRPSMNGVQTYPVGSNAGMLINTLYGLPLFVSNDVPKDTISRLYLLDLDNLSLNVGIPTQYTEAGMSTGDEILLDRLGDRGHYYSMMELWCTRFKSQAKLRDLQ